MTAVRPYWLSQEEELEVRREMNEGKLQAVKLLRTISIDKGIIRADVLDSSGYPMKGIGLKDAKEYIDQLKPIGKSLSELITFLETTDMLKSLIKDAFPSLSDESIQKAIPDVNFLRRLVTTEEHSNKYGI